MVGMPKMQEQFSARALSSSIPKNEDMPEMQEHFPARASGPESRITKPAAFERKYAGNAGAFSGACIRAGIPKNETCSV